MRRQALRALQRDVRRRSRCAGNGSRVAMHLAEHAGRQRVRDRHAGAGPRDRRARRLRLRAVDDDHAAIGAQQLEAGLEHALEQPIEIVLDADRARLSSTIARSLRSSSDVVRRRGRACARPRMRSRTGRSTARRRRAAATRVTLRAPTNVPRRLPRSRTVYEPSTPAHDLGVVARRPSDRRVGCRCRAAADRDPIAELVPALAVDLDQDEHGHARVEVWLQVSVGQL